jgi:hypothetical protein
MANRIPHQAPTYGGNLRNGNKILLISIVLLWSLPALTQDLRKIPNESFQRGEKLTYRAYYDAFLTGKVTAGEAVLEVAKENKIISGRNTMHIIGRGYSKGAFNFFFRVRDNYETYIDEETLAPWLFIRRVYEGGYTASQDVTFNQHKKLAYFVDNKHKRSTVISTPQYAHDIISAFYYARNLDFTNASINQEYPVQFLFDDSVYVSKIVYLGKETIKTSTGTYRCLKFKPMVLTGNVFSDPYPMVLWITDDKNRIPVMGESKILVGTVKLELTKAEGLRNPMTSKIR